MIARALLFLSIIGGLILPGVAPDTVSAEIVANVNTGYEFGSTISFSLQLTHPGDAVQLILMIEPESQGRREIPLALNGEQDIRYIYDLDSNPIRPFSRVYYWFEIQSTDGSTKKSPSYWFDYVDDTFDWKTSESDLFTIHYVDLEQDFIQQVQNTARDGLKEATKILPVVPKIPIQIYLYPDLASLQSAMTRSHQPWAAGHADPELGVVLVSLPGEGEESASLERQIPHELMHILQYSVTGTSYSNAAAWLLEGMASTVELYPDPDRERALGTAYKENNLIPISGLCQPFANDAQSAYLAYAESHSFVSYLSQRFGSSSLDRLLSTYANGLDCNSAVKQVYSLSIDQLDNEWRSAEFEGNAHSLGYLEYWPVFLISAIILVSLAIIGLRAITRHKSRPEVWTDGK